MDPKILNLTVDFTKQRKYIEPSFVKGDTECYINVTTVQDITNSTVIIAFEDSANNTFLDDCTNTGANTCELNLKSDVLQTEGRVECQIAIYEDEQRLTNVVSFFYTVIKDISDKAVQASDNLPILTKLITEVQELCDDLGDISTVPDDPTNKFFNGNKQWTNVTHDQTIDKNSNDAYLHRTLADKEKLDGVDTGANLYVLPNDVVQDEDYNNYSDAEKQKLEGVEDGAEVNVNPDWNATIGDAEILNKPTTISGYGITDAYNKTEIDNKISSVYKFKGNVATFGDLPVVDLTVGDVYNVLDSGINYAWNGSEWDDIGGVEALATATNNGLMSKEDFSKLEGVEANANYYVLPDIEHDSLVDKNGNDDYLHVTLEEKEIINTTTDNFSNMFKLIEMASYRVIIQLKMNSGLFDFSCDLGNPTWLFADGTIISGKQPSITLTEPQMVYLSYDRGVNVNIDDVNTNENFIGDLSSLSAITYYLRLLNCTNITGDLSSLSAITYYLNLANCTNITGAYTQVNGTNVPSITYLDNTNISATDMDSTLIAYSLCTKDNGTFRANGMTRTSVSDDAVSTLTSRGWTISGLTKV